MSDWETKYRTGDMPWDKGRAAPPLLELMERRGTAIWNSGPVLVPGCGLGHDVRAIAACGVPALGLDIAESAVSKARSFPSIGVESYETGDFLDPAWSDGRRFAAIWEHTCFCAIQPTSRETYGESAAALLDPGGVLAGVFFLTPNDPGEDDEGPPFGVSVVELDARFSPWFERIGGWVPRASYPGRSGREWLGIYRKLPSAGLRDRHDATSVPLKNHS